ncbi:unannotated protein [freshwater metagenome]|uniref:Unannotated protein n=1 Tax=freshwater metagenome TaxID=449393 RepID=A0A6J7I3M4_9ZZZZ
MRREARSRLTLRRLFGLDRSGPPPAATLADAPLRPWTIPNAIGYVRLALVPVFVAVSWHTDGVGVGPAVLFGVISWGDYADGIAARVTGQYSRLGAMLDPLVDRLLVIAGVVVCWNFDLVPRWLLGVLVVRELAMLALAPLALRRGLELRINWWGRLGVWPAMSALFFGVCGLRDLATVLLAIGVAMLLVASVAYARDARRQHATGARST